MYQWLSWLGFDRRKARTLVPADRRRKPLAAALKENTAAHAMLAREAEALEEESELTVMRLKMS